MTKVKLLDFAAAPDARGLLTAAQYPDSLPFVPIRVFFVTNSPAGAERGGHAHRTCHQILVATAGKVLVEVDDDDGTHVVTLTEATRGLYIPPLAWACQKYELQGASLTVLASHAYDVHDYVDDRTESQQLREANGGS